MIIGIDIDDTLSSLYDYKLKKAAEYIQKNKLKYKLIDDSAYLLGDIFDWDEKTRNEFWWSEFNQALLNTPVQKDASKITHQLKKDGHTIIVITARTD